MENHTFVEVSRYYLNIKTGLYFFIDKADMECKTKLRELAKECLEDHGSHEYEIGGDFDGKCVRCGKETENK